MQEYSVKMRSVPWLMMPWLCVAPGHQQPCLLTVLDNLAPVFHGEGLQWTVPFWYWEIIENANIFLFPQENSACENLIPGISYLGMVSGSQLANMPFDHSFPGVTL